MLWVVPCCRTKSSRTRREKGSFANRNEGKTHHDTRELICERGREVRVRIGKSPWYIPLAYTTHSSPLSHARHLGLPSFCPTQAEEDSSAGYLSRQHAKRAVPAAERVECSSRRTASDDSPSVVLCKYTFIHTNVKENLARPRACVVIQRLKRGETEPQSMTLGCPIRPGVSEERGYFDGGEQKRRC